jgi:hypothetical protein
MRRLFQDVKGFVYGILITVPSGREEVHSGTGQEKTCIRLGLVHHILQRCGAEFILPPDGAVKYHLRLGTPFAMCLTFVHAPYLRE